MCFPPENRIRYIFNLYCTNGSPNKLSLCMVAWLQSAIVSFLHIFTRFSHEARSSYDRSVITSVRVFSRPTHRSSRAAASSRDATFLGVCKGKSWCRKLGQPWWGTQGEIMLARLWPRTCPLTTSLLPSSTFLILVKRNYFAFKFLLYSNTETQKRLQKFRIWLSDQTKKFK